MSDLEDQYRAAVNKVSEYEMLGSLTVDRKKREAYRTQAKFHDSMAHELRAKLESLPKLKEPAND
jgi:hypothetical protein